MYDGCNVYNEWSKDKKKLNRWTCKLDQRNPI